MYKIYLHFSLYTFHYTLRTVPSQNTKLALAFCGGVVAWMVIQNGIDANQPKQAASVVTVPTPTQAPAPAEEQSAPQSSQRQFPPEHLLTPPQRGQQQRPAGWECDLDDHCPGIDTICNANRKCERLRDVTCTCTQVNVLQCADAQQRARHTRCPNGCQNYREGGRGL